MNGSTMFSDVDRVIRAAVAHEREIQRDIADKQAQDEQR